jgi:hypothetical protein
MAANRQQGEYLAGFIAGFTGLPAGLIGLAYGRPVIGGLVTVVGLALLVYSLVGLRRIKTLEFTGE